MGRSRPSFGRRTFSGTSRDALHRRPLRCRWALQPGFCIASRGVASAVIVRSRLSPGLRSFSELVAIRRIAGLCGAAGHSNRGFAQPQGGWAQGRIGLCKFCQLFATGRHVEQLRLFESREPPPPRAGRATSSVLVAFPAGVGPPFLARQARLACRAAPGGNATRPPGVLPACRAGKL